MTFYINSLVKLSPPTVNVEPGEDIQSAWDSTPPGARLVLKPGEHLVTPQKYDALLYIDKPGQVQLESGAILKASGGYTYLHDHPEIAWGIYTLSDGKNDLSARYDPTLGTPSNTYDAYTVVDVWFRNIDNTEYIIINYDPGIGLESQLIDINNLVGTWYDTGIDNIQIQFDSNSGHNNYDRWRVYAIASPLYGIRIGRGYQEKYIDGVRIFGDGLIDLQFDVAHNSLQSSATNMVPHIMQEELEAGIAVFGRCRNIHITGRVDNVGRPLMVYGWHTGERLPYGVRGPGISYNPELICVNDFGNNSYHSVLLGHPSWRGRTRAVSLYRVFRPVELNFRSMLGEDVYGVHRLTGVHLWRGMASVDIRHSILTNVEELGYSTPPNWPVAVNIREHDVVHDTSPPPATYEPWSPGSFPAGWAYRSKLSIPTSATIDTGQIYLPVYDATLINSINTQGEPEGRDLRASYDRYGTVPAPLDRFVDENGTLIGVSPGFVCTDTEHPTEIYLWWGKSGELEPPRAIWPEGGFRALPDGLLARVSGDSETNSVAASSMVSGTYTYRAIQPTGPIEFRNSLDDNLWNDEGMGFAVWSNPNPGGVLMDFDGIIRLEHLIDGTIIATIGSNKKIYAGPTGLTRLCLSVNTNSRIAQLIVNGNIVYQAFIPNNDNLSAAEHYESQTVNVLNYSGTIEDLILTHKPIPPQQEYAYYKVISESSLSVTEDNP